MRTIGIDLAISATHKAVVVDERGNAITPLLDVTAAPAVLDDLLRRAREGADEEERLRVVMEPTSLSWLPIASYVIQREETVHLVNTQQISDLRSSTASMPRAIVSAPGCWLACPGSTPRRCMLCSCTVPTISVANAGASSKTSWPH